ncbi:MAG TPA: AMP-binding protein [Bradyrhizobium sp.]
MSSESYADVVRAFDWSTVHEALGWKPGEKVSLGASIVDRHAASERVALICVGPNGTERRLTYRELSEASNCFANLLQRLGVEPGDRVAGLMPRGPEVIIAIIGTLKLGAIYVPIFTGFGPDSIRFRLDHGQAKVLVTHQDVRKQLPSGLSLRIICVSQPGLKLPAEYIDFGPELQKQAAEFVCVPRARDDVAAIIYTSGSTGQPKGGSIAVNFLAAIWPYVIYGLDLRRDDIFWPTGDPGWGYGFVCYLSALAAGATVISVQQNPTAELCLSILQRYRVTNLATTPTLLRSLLVLDEEILRTADIRLHALSSCGEPLNAKVVESFRQLWRVTPMDHFGATEYAIPIGNFNAISMPVKAGSMGRPFPGFRMAIVDEDGNEQPAGEVGFIGKKFDPDYLYWMNYWGDPAASRDLVRCGWIVTGDLGRRDADGYFWFEGRAGDMIKSAGYRIGPFEVESALLKHPAVAEAAVVGKPDELRGEIVKAFVVLRPGTSGNDELSHELALFVRETVGGHQTPRAIEFIDALPKTETGKIQRFALRERA